MSDLRELASTTYNRAFALIVEGGQDDVSEGLELAATSLFLWRQVGTERNWSIGEWLFARALFKAGAQDLAIKEASHSVELAEQVGTDWLIASGLEGLARVSQGRPEFDALVARAEAAIAAIAEADARTLISEQFADLKGHKHG